jgi:NDP-sugar pyrophosphorylase family protein
MKAVILAGGLGTRLRPFTDTIPKPLLPVGEKSILEIQIARLKEYGFDEIYLATNYKSDYISNFFGDGSRYGVKLIISKEEKPLGTAGPIKLLQKELQDAQMVQLTVHAELMNKSRQSSIAKMLQDKGSKVKESNTPAIKIQ